MVGNKVTRRNLFSYLDLPRAGKGEPVTDMVAMTVEFLKYQGEVAYEIGKRQAITITSSASTIGIGWSAFFFGILQESWFTSSAGLMMVFAGTFILGYWTPKIVDKLRWGLDEFAETKFYNKWMAERAKSEGAEKEQ